MKRAHGNTGRKRSRRAAVPATEAAKHFGRLVDRVREERTVYVVERGGVPVAQLGPVERPPCTMADFKALADEWPAAGDEYLREMERAVERHNRPRVRPNPWTR